MSTRLNFVKQNLGGLLNLGFFVKVSFMETDARNYEVAYIMSLSVPEESVLTETAKLSNLIENSKGMVKYAETPKKIKLAYPIKKERVGYFGWIVFNAAPSALKNIEKELKEKKEILRHLIVLKETRETTVRPFIPAAPGAKHTQTEPKGARPTEAETKEDRRDLEALDKKLEEILGR